MAVAEARRLIGESFMLFHQLWRGTVTCDHHVVIGW
jgi:hypothetical protein